MKLLLENWREYIEEGDLSGGACYRATYRTIKK